MPFKLEKNLLFIDSMQFMISSLKNLVKVLSQEFCGQQLELVKQKAIYPYGYMNIYPYGYMNGFE